MVLILHLILHNRIHRELLIDILANAASFWLIPWNSLKSKSRCPMVSAAAGLHSLNCVWAAIYKSLEKSEARIQLGQTRSGASSSLWQNRTHVPFGNGCHPVDVTSSSGGGVVQGNAMLFAEVLRLEDDEGFPRLKIFESICQTEGPR